MNQEMVIRITRYYRILNRLRALGLERVFAHNLADAAGVSAATVRKDFSLLSIQGQKRGGYEINELTVALGQILGKKGQPEHVVIVGCGRIGKALMYYNGFEQDGIKIVAGFDSDAAIYNDHSLPVPVYPPSRLEEVIRKSEAKVAIVTVPETATSDTFQQLIQAGIEGVLNFSPITLKPAVKADGSKVVVHNVNIALELEQIFYQLHHACISEQDQSEES